MENTIKAKVAECAERRFEERVYYQLVLSGSNVELGTISCGKPHREGDVVEVCLKRSKDFRLVPRVVE